MPRTIRVTTGHVALTWTAYAHIDGKHSADYPDSQQVIEIVTHCVRRRTDKSKNVAEATYTNITNIPAAAMLPPNIHNFEISKKISPMIEMRKPYAISSHALVLVALLATLPNHVFAQSVSARIPENAHGRQFDRGWECNNGFRQVDDTCIAIEIPAHAYPTNQSYGRGWECNWGYRKEGETCVMVELPANAYLNAPEGDRWTCNRGYRQVKQACVAVNVPSNAYLNSSRSAAWTCDRGYRQVEDACVIIKAPLNGYLTDSSYGRPGWKCERGHRAVKGACVAVNVPQNAFLEESSYGAGWRCERGFRKVKGSCLVVQIPENAHLDYSGTAWECNPPFRKQGDRCAAR
jgi:hypothetical protein